MEIALWVADATKAKEYADLGIRTAWANEGATPSTLSMDDYKNKLEAGGLNLWSFPYNVCKNPGGVFTPSKISMQDEPVMHGMTSEQYDAQREKFKTLAPNILIVGNFEGDKFSLFKPTPVDSRWTNVNNKNGPYLGKNSIDYFDFFIFNRPRYNTDGTFDWYPIDNIFASIDFILQYNKEVGVIIEASNQCIDVNSRAPNRAELRLELIGSLIWGAKHLAFFFNRPGNKPPKWATYGTANDAVPPENKQEIKILLDFCKKYEDILDNREGTIREVNLPFISRVWPDGHELILNRTKKPATTAKGVAYAAYEARFYLNDELLWKADQTSPTLPYSPPTPVPIEDGTVPKADYDKLMIDYKAAQDKVTSLTNSLNLANVNVKQNQAVISELQAALAAAQNEMSQFAAAVNTLLKLSQHGTATPVEPVSLPPNMPLDVDTSPGSNNP